MKIEDIQEINRLVDELVSINSKSAIVPFFIKAQNSLVGIFGQEHYYSRNLIQDSKVLFKSTDAITLKELKLEEQKTFESGKQVLIDGLKNAKNEIQRQIDSVNNSTFIAESVLEELKNLQILTFDLKKLIRYCEEINYNYISGNYISTIMLGRAVINHIPPIFGSYTKFSDVVYNYNKNPNTNRNDILNILQNGLRQLGDLQNHDLISKATHLPTKNQIEPFKGSFEYLIQEIITVLTT